MDIKRSGSQPSTKGPDECFAGNVEAGSSVDVQLFS